MGMGMGMGMSGASAATMAAFNQLKASGNAGSGITGGAQAYWNNNAAEAERIRKLREQQASAQRAQQATAAANAERQIQAAQRAAQERSRTQEYQQQAQNNNNRNNNQSTGIQQSFRVAGENGISKSEFKTIAETTGKRPEKLIGKLDKINTKLADKDKAGINLNSGAANMLIKKAQKSSDRYRGYRTPDF